MEQSHSLAFFKGFLTNPAGVGAIAPSSPALAEALCTFYRRATAPVAILEVGAGTGAVTRKLASFLRESDSLDVCEIQPAFADVLERRVFALPTLARGVQTGRVRLINAPVETITETGRYDFVISGLPFTAFTVEQTQDIFQIIRRCLKPSGVFSYFEYVGVRGLLRAFSIGKRRERISRVSAFLTRQIHDYQVKRHTVPWNFLPAYTRHLRFDGQAA